MFTRRAFCHALAGLVAALKFTDPDSLPEIDNQVDAAAAIIEDTSSVILLGHAETPDGRSLPVSWSHDGHVRNVSGVTIPAGSRLSVGPVERCQLLGSSLGDTPAIDNGVAPRVNLEKWSDVI